MNYFRQLGNKLQNLAFGKSAEADAARLLKKHGYAILETNYRCKGGEIDIVASEGKVLVFCEVKARRNKNYGSALEGLTPQKARKIKAAAEHYLMKNNVAGVDIRFDVVTMDGVEGAQKVELIRNAF